MTFKPPGNRPGRLPVEETEKPSAVAPVPRFDDGPSLELARAGRKRTQVDLVERPPTTPRILRRILLLLLAAMLALALWARVNRMLDPEDGSYAPAAEPTTPP